MQIINPKYFKGSVQLKQEYFVLGLMDSQLEKSHIFLYDLQVDYYTLKCGKAQHYHSQWTDGW